VIDDHKRHAAAFGFGANFVKLTASDERGGIKRIANLQKRAADFGAGADGEFFEFFEGVAADGARIQGAAAGSFLYADAHEQDAFAIVNGLGRSHAARLRATGEGAVTRVMVIPEESIRRTAFACE
jgi:hypothetical protein